MTVFNPHTTAGMTVNEGADPDVVRDLDTILDRIVPWIGGYRHAEGNAAAHAKAILTGSSVTLLVRGGRLVLGTWQTVWFCEYDGPRTRHAVGRGRPGPRRRRGGISARRAGQRAETSSMVVLAVRANAAGGQGGVGRAEKATGRRLTVPRKPTAWARLSRAASAKP